MSKKKDKRRNKILGITGGDRAMGERLKRAKPTFFEQAKNVAEAPTIGLGLESNIKAVKIRREDIHIDQHTQGSGADTRHHALYIAGWSLKNDTHE